MVVAVTGALVGSAKAMRTPFLAAACLIACVIGGCTSGGSLDLSLELPSATDLRPTGMTTVTVLASSPAMAPVADTSAIGDGTFGAGDLPIGDNISIGVLLRNAANRLVGVGEAANPVRLSADQTTQLSVPVRRPFVYAASGSSIYTYDPTLDPSDPKFQGQLAGLTTPQLAISVGGDRLVIASLSDLRIVDTATHMVTGSPIPIGGSTGAMIHDAAAVPGTHVVAVGSSAGISIADIDTGMVQDVAGPSVDKVAVGPAADGHMVVYGLVGRVDPPGGAGALDACSGTSSLVVVDATNPTGMQMMALGDAVSDIAAAPDTAKLFGTLPCSGEVAEIDNGKLTKLSSLPNASVLAVAEGQVFAAGVKPSTPFCEDPNDPNGNPMASYCTTMSSHSCTNRGGSAPGVLYAVPGASLILQTIPIGGQPMNLELPERRETMIATTDNAGEQAEVLHPLTLRPLDLVVLPGGQYVSIVAASEYYIADLVSGSFVIEPCLDVTTGDWLLVDLASSSIAQRVRTECNLTMDNPPNAFFPTWKCDDAPAGEAATQGEYQPVAVGALFGAR